MLGFGKWKTEEWRGEVSEKSEIKTNTSDGNDYSTYYLYIKLADGEVKRKSYNKKVWDGFEVGDKIEKRLGEKQPVKI